MPRTTKKTVKKTKVTRKEQAENVADTVKAKLANLNISSSYTSLAYGVITVIVIFALIFAAIRVFTQDNTPAITENGINTTTEESASNVHVVQEGETLWSISEKVYNDGFAWNEIAEANKLTDPSNLEAGTRLTIPAREAVATDPSMEASEPVATATPTMTMVSPTVAQTEQAQQPTGTSITGTTYVVQAGDTLWDISVRAFGTGYRWGEIATANSLGNPNLIFSGTTLTLPAK